MSEYISNLPLCPHCYRYSLVYFIIDKPKEILIQCNNCRDNQPESLHNYLDKMSRTYTIINDNIRCNTHFEICNRYCIQCQICLCNECIMHNYLLHDCVPIKGKISTEKINNQIKEAYFHINIYCNELKTQGMSNKDYNNNDEIENSYQSFYKRNNDILKMIQMIINSYNKYPFNYYFSQNVSNLIHTKYINIYKYIDKYSDIGVINYFNNYNILDIICNIENITKIKTIKEHSKYVNALLLISDGRLASCSEDSTIKIYNRDNYNCDITITEHTDYVIYISHFEYNKIISCCADRTINIWSISQSSYQCDYTIKRAHYEWIYKVIPLTNYEIASCSADNTIRIWNSRCPVRVALLKGHKNIVKSIIKLKNQNILVSVSKDTTLRKWNLLSYQCVTIIQNVKCSSSNGLLEIDNNKIIVGGKYKVTIVNI